MQTALTLLAFTLLAFTLLATIGGVSAAPASEPASLEKMASLDQHRLAMGFRALESSCFGCHSPEMTTDSRVAPPMAAIKKHYVGPDTTFETFSRTFVEFVDNPTAANSQMPGAIETFGLMPQLSMEPEVVQQIAYYLFNTPLERPGWFQRDYGDEQRRHRASVKATLASDADYLRYGKEIAMRAKAALGSNLKGALNTGDTVSAIRFCEANAVPITRGISSEHGASVSRVSDRPRNPGNRANPREMQYIENAKAAQAKGDPLKPLVQQIDGHMVAYYPIVTNGMCLQCHGRLGSEISPETAAALHAKYPLDEATGYGANDIRGLFVVEMEQQ